MPTVRWDIYEDLLSEAGFLWTQWNHALRAPDYTLDEVTRGDEARLLAALDGLLVGGPALRERLLAPLLAESEDAEQLVAASWAMLAAEDTERGPDEPPEDVLGPLLDGIEAAPDERLAGLEWALVLAPPARVRATVTRLLQDPEPSLQALALRVLGARPELMEDAAPLEKFLRGDRPQTLAASLRALPPVLEPRHRARVEDLIRVDEPATRNAALEVGTILGIQAARRVCYDLAESRDDTAGTALLLLAISAVPADMQIIVKALASPVLRVEALWALGFAGTRQAAEACLPFADDDELGRLAVEGFSLVTGLDAAREGLARPPDEDADSKWLPVRTEPRESELTYKPDQQMPLADAEAVENWWADRSAAFQPGMRYRYGVPFDPAAIWTALDAGPCRRRPVHALEAAMQAHGRALVSVRRWTADQRAQTQRARQEAGRR